MKMDAANTYTHPPTAGGGGWQLIQLIGTSPDQMQLAVTTYPAALSAVADLPKFHHHHVRCENDLHRPKCHLCISCSAAHCPHEVLGSVRAEVDRPMQAKLPPNWLVRDRPMHIF